MRLSKITVLRDGVEITQLNGMRTQSMKERLGGLLILEPLKADHALWIMPCNSVHTFGMKYALDLVYIDKNKQICGLVENVKPWRMSFFLRAKAVMELMAGSIQNLNIQLGDKCTWQD